MFKLTDDFCAKYGDDVFLQICEVCWGPGEDASIVVFEQRMRDYANSDYSVSYTAPLGEEVFLSLEIGDRNGSRITKIADEPIDLDPPPRRVLKPAPLAATLDPEARALRERKFAAMSRQPWFLELQREMAYDLMVSPTNLIRDHYRQAAAKHGLVIGYADED